jgi:hypothetical protein
MLKDGDTPFYLAKCSDVSDNRLLARGSVPSTTAKEFRIALRATKRDENRIPEPSHDRKGVVLSPKRDRTSEMAKCG